jgi:hypothetical protein
MMPSLASVLVAKANATPENVVPCACQSMECYRWFDKQR